MAQFGFGRYEFSEDGFEKLRRDLNFVLANLSGANFSGGAVTASVSNTTMANSLIVDSTFASGTIANSTVSNCNITGSTFTQGTISASTLSSCYFSACTFAPSTVVVGAALSTAVTGSTTLTVAKANSSDLNKTRELLNQIRDLLFNLGLCT